MAGHHQTVDKVQTGKLEDITKKIKLQKCDGRKNGVAAFFK
jgi:hypothetical protein